MFNVVFNINDSYVKYMSVFCYSIIYHAKTNGGG